MFSISKKKENGFDVIVLKDTANGSLVEILPAHGALLHSFYVINEHKESINVIEQYKDADDVKNNQEANGFKSAKLSPYVCRLANGSYTFGEHQYKVENFYMGDSAIHGLLYNRAFTVVHTNADEGSASVTLLAEYRKNDKGYPFNYDCQVTYSLQKENTLTITTKIINKDAGNIPVTDGWHPYFTFGNSINHLQLEFQSKEMLEFDEGLLPTGRLLPYQDFGSLRIIGDTFFDNCFTVNFAECQPMLVLRDTDKKMQLEIYPEKTYPYLQIYTPPHRNSIAIENLSSAPNAFNNAIGLRTLAPGKEADFITTYKIALIHEK
ncbi:MAG: aldose 1-epimerase [Bacteroidetes bacterium]|nr:aldose 1-epimerase [Bacteroidota bacterium]